jgi:DivIVA domain-containing protein
VHLSPDEIERRTFAIEDRGYDRDEVRVFLLEVAAALRLALHTTRPPVVDVAPVVALPSVPATVRARGDDFARLGSEVAEVLRSAHDAVAALHQQADVEIAARREEALAQGEEIRRQAETDASWTHDRAKRVLITAQDQADAIVAEAEATAAEVLATARRQAREHADQVATRTRRHAEQILRAEREALRRLHQAQAGVAAAVEMLTGSETRPVVDLTELRPNVRLGSLSVEVEPEPAPELAPATNDPLARMIRNAVDRATEHAREVAEPEHPAEGPGSGVGALVDDARSAGDPLVEAADHQRNEDRGTPGPTARLATSAAPRTAPAAGAAPPVAPVAPVRVVRPAPRPDPGGATPVTAADDGRPRSAR